MTAPDPAFVVQQQLFPPGPQPADAITLYEGAEKAKNGFAPWRAWDLRGPVLKLAWDLLRFRKLSDGKAIAAEIAADPTKAHSLYDWVLYVAYQLSQSAKPPTPPAA